MTAHVFVTGGTGFIGRRLVAALLKRPRCTVHLLLRPAAAASLPALLEGWGLRGVARRRVVAHVGDVTRPHLGLDAATRTALKGQIDEVFHLAAVYDLEAEAETTQRVNVDGTRRVVAFAEAIGARHLLHVSSIAVAGMFDGTFTEAMFDEATGLEVHPYFASKHAAEAVVRAARLPWTVVRPGLVVGDSRDGATDKADGPYLAFPLIQRVAQALPDWLPGVGLQGGWLHLVPVDYVVACIEHLSRTRPPAERPRRGPAPGRCFHVVSPEALRVGDVLNTLSQAAGGPRLAWQVDEALRQHAPGEAWGLLRHLVPNALQETLRNAALHDLGLPAVLWHFLHWPTRFDRRALDAALSGSGITCPPLADYAPLLWAYWARHLDPALRADERLATAVAGQTVLVTGGSSGIGLAAARRLAQAGATVLICARDAHKLAQACRDAAADGLALQPYAVDLADAEATEAFLQQLRREHGGVDILVNNAGRSIRRAVVASYGRFHDFERQMQLNYFGALRVTLGLLPHMAARGRGHVVNISSIAALTGMPRYAGYVASKAALDAWTRCAAAEFAGQGVRFSTVHMPLVRTPMIEPTPLYAHLPVMSADEAAELVAQACCTQPQRLATRLGLFGLWLHTLMPELAHTVLAAGFDWFEGLAPQGPG